MTNVLGCDTVVSEFELQSCYYVHFQINTLCKGMNPLIIPWVKEYHSCSSTGMDLALNNPRRLTCHQTKKQYPKGTTTAGQGEPGNNGKEGILYTSMISRTRFSPSDYYPEHPFISLTPSVGDTDIF